jgi:hypothetical protein
VKDQIFREIQPQFYLEEKDFFVFKWQWERKLIKCKTRWNCKMVALLKNGKPSSQANYKEGILVDVPSCLATKQDSNFKD